MAGKRRATGRELRRITSVERRKERLRTELAATSDPRDRVFIAADYVRTGLAWHPDAQVAEEIVEQLIAAGDRIYQTGRGAA